jgi:hypothetical protein
MRSVDGPPAMREAIIARHNGSVDPRECLEDVGYTIILRAVPPADHGDKY